MKVIYCVFPSFEFQSMPESAEMKSLIAFAFLFIQENLFSAQFFLYKTMSLMPSNMSNRRKYFA